MRGFITSALKLKTLARAGRKRAVDRAAANMRRAICIVGLAFLLLPAALAQPSSVESVADRVPTGEESIRLRIVPSNEVAAQPGDIKTVAFKVFNSTPEAERLVQVLDLPDGWHAVTPVSRVTLPPNQETTRMASFSIPMNTPARSYTVRLNMQDDASVLRAQSELTVRVEPRYSIRVRLLGAPAHVPAGDTYTAQFLITNDSNVGVPVFLSTASNRRYPIRVLTPVTRLEPRSSVPVDISVRTSSKELIEKQHQLTLTASLPDTVSITASARSQVAVIPRANALDAGGPTLPAQVAMQTVRAPHRSSVQIEASGEGALNRDGTSEAKFMVRTPTSSINRFVRQDEYHAEYTSTRFDLRVGDLPYSRSPLSDPGNYGTGAGTEVRLNRFTVGGHYHWSRLSMVDRERAVSYMSMRPTTNTQLDLNLAHASGSQSGRMASLRSAFQASPAFELETELGAHTGGPLTHLAAAIDARGQYSRGSYQVQFLRAPASYPNANAGITRFSSYTSLRLYRGLVFDGLLQRRRQVVGAALGTNTGLIDHASLYRIGTSLRRRTGTRDWASSIRMQRNQSSLQQNTRASLTVQSHVRQDAFAFGGSFRWGYVQRVLSRSHLSEYSAKAAYTYQTLRLGSTLRYSRNTIPGVNSYHRWRTDLELAWRPSKTMTLRISGNRQWYADASLPTFAQLSTSLEYELPFGHQLHLQTYGSDADLFGGAHHSLVSFSYVVPTGLPLVASRYYRQSRVVRGRVYDVETKQGIAGAVLRLGSSRVVTDRQGTFIIPYHATTGTEALLLDRMSLGMGRVPLDASPIIVGPVGPTAADTPHIDIPTTVSATLTVRVVKAPSTFARDTASATAHADSLGLSAIRNQVALQKSIPAEGILVEASDASENFRRLTSSTGDVVLYHLRPGTWRLRFLGHLPDNYHAQQREHIVTLSRGEEQELTLVLLPTPQRLHMDAPGGFLRPAMQSTD